MSPADGAFFGLAAEAPAALVPDLAIILPGGRTLLAISGLADALPSQGSCGDAPWQAVCWPVQNGRAGLALVLSTDSGTEAWRPFAGMVGSSVLLGAAFVAMGYLISTLVRDRGTAGGIAIGVWLLFVLVYDMALLGVLVADQGRTVNGAVLNGLLLFNPADAYRLLNLAGTADISMFSGMSGLAAQDHPGQAALLAALVGWTVLPLLAAITLFNRRQV